MAYLAWQITGPGTLTLKDLGPISQPGPRQVLVQIKAVALNYRDILVVDHDPSYPLQAKPDLVPCSDGAGVVVASGPQSQWEKGERVFIHPNTWKSGFDPRGFSMDETMGGGEVVGTLRRFMVVDDDRLLKIPAGLEMEEAATVYTAGVTAWHALFHGWIRLEPGMTVLTMGTGGVSCYAILIAAAHGARVVATSSSDEKLEVAGKLGARHLINYKKTSDWAGEVLEVTGSKGVDIVVDVVGAQSIEQSIKATRHGGLVSLVGMLSDDPNKPVNILPSLLFGAKTVQGILGAGSMDMFKELSAFMEKHNIHPPIASVFDFEDADKALAAVAKLSTPGKVVIKL